MRYTGFHRALEIDLRAHRSSWQIHVSNQIEADRLDELRQKYRDKGLTPPTYTACVIKAIALAIAELKPANPQLNSFLRNVFGFKSIHVFDGISAGCSTALETEDAVIVGVVLEPQKKSLTDVTRELSTFSSKGSPFAKDALMFYKIPKPLQVFFHWLSKNMWKVRYERRGTFCLNPVGKFGVDMHISLPQTSSLQFGMGGVRDRVVAREGKPYVTPSFFSYALFRSETHERETSFDLDVESEGNLDRAEFDDWRGLDSSGGR